jgi:adenosylcobinamide-phosphate synthase
MNDFERDNYRDARAAGVKHAMVGAALGVGAGFVVRSTAVATGVAVGGRALHDAAGAVGDALSAGDLERARELLPTLVGRNSSELDETEIARATVESVAENTVDAIVAPALWATLAGSSGAFGYRALNTMDAMVGHRSERYSNYGWASARLDDVANWVPARCTAALVALVRPAFAKDVHRAVRTQAPAHPSPNSGVAEAAFAAALGLRLGGRSYYAERVEDRPTLGTGRSAEPADIAKAIRLSRDVSSALAVILGVMGVAAWVRSR